MLKIVKKPFQERRKGPDGWLRSLSWIAYAGWVMMFVALVFWDKARPQIQTWIDDLVGVRKRPVWDLELAEYIFYFMVFSMIISGAGLLINARRHRRKKDTYRLSLVGLAIASMFGAMAYLIFLK